MFASSTLNNPVIKGARHAAIGVFALGITLSLTETNFFDQSTWSQLVKWSGVVGGGLMVASGLSTMLIGD